MPSKLAEIRIRCHPLVKEHLVELAKEKGLTISQICNLVLKDGLSDDVGEALSPELFGVKVGRKRGNKKAPKPIKTPTKGKSRRSKARKKKAKETKLTKLKTKKGLLSQYKKDLESKAEAMNESIQQFARVLPLTGAFVRALECLTASDEHIPLEGFSFAAYRLVDYFNSCLLVSKDQEGALQALFTGLEQWDKGALPPDSLAHDDLQSLIFAYCSDNFSAWYEEHEADNNELINNPSEQTQMLKEWGAMLQKGFGDEQVSEGT